MKAKATLVDSKELTTAVVDREPWFVFLWERSLSSLVDTETRCDHLYYNSHNGMMDFGHA